MLRGIQKLKSHKAFSILEVITVTVIVGILASLALPRYQDTIEKSKSAEGIDILASLLRAQKAHALENNGTYATDINNLDVSFDSIEYFNAPNVFDPADPTANPLATIQRSGNASTLNIFEDGTLTCSGGTLCSKWGY